MIVVFRKKVAIIDLFKSLTALRIALVLLTNIVFMRGPIWFLNLEPSFEFYVRRAALACGEFVITKRWIRGVISNFFMVFNAFRRLNYFAPSVWSMKQRKYESFFRRWYLMRLSWPRLMFISHAKTAYFAAKETADFKIPIMSIVDTDVHTQSSLLPIPGNDESLACMVFYHDLFSRFIMRQKFGLLARWFFHVRSGFRALDFAEWLRDRYKLGFRSKTVLFETGQANAILKSVLLSFPLKRTMKVSTEEVLLEEVSTVDLAVSFSNFANAWRNIIMCISLDLFKRSLSFNPVFKEDVFTDLYFKLRFLAGDYFWKEFLPKKYFVFIEDEGAFDSKLLWSIIDVYFLYRYFSSLKLFGVDLLKFKYWRRVSPMVGFVSFGGRNLLWHRFFPELRDRVVLPKLSGTLNIRTWTLDNDVAVESTSLYVSRAHFGASLPFHFWYWNSIFFLPSSFGVDYLYGGYFFRRFFTVNKMDGGFIVYREVPPYRGVYWANSSPKWFWV